MTMRRCLVLLALFALCGFAYAGSDPAQVEKDPAPPAPDQAPAEQVAPTAPVTDDPCAPPESAEAAETLQSVEPESAIQVPAPENGAVPICILTYCPEPGTRCDFTGVEGTGKKACCGYNCYVDPSCTGKQNPPNVCNPWE